MCVAALLVVSDLAGIHTAAAQSSPTVQPQTGIPQSSPADTRFIQGMIHHHAQALVMTALIPTHSQSEAMQLLGERISVSQRDEIGLMQRWLRNRGQAVPEPPVTLAQYDAGSHHMMMPGMLTGDELHELAAASGPEFDRLFLAGMIKHHGGALTMVADLFGTPGGGQDSWIYQFAADIEASQRAEIQRMSAMLTALTSGTRRP